MLAFLVFDVLGFVCLVVFCVCLSVLFVLLSDCGCYCCLFD